MRILSCPGSVDVAEIMERIFDNGIVVDPTTQLNLGKFDAAHHKVVVEEDGGRFLLAA